MKSCDPSLFITTNRGVQYCDIVVWRGPVVQDRKKGRVSYTVSSEQNIKLERFY